MWSSGSTHKWIVAKSIKEDSSKTIVGFIEPNTLEMNQLYNSEINSKSTGCGLSVVEDRITFFNGDTFAISNPSESDSTNIFGSIFGVNFCNGNKVGDNCSRECTLSRSFSNSDFHF